MPGAAAEPFISDTIPHSSLPCHTSESTNPCDQLSPQLSPSLSTSHSCSSSRGTARSFLIILNIPEILLFCLVLVLQEESWKLEALGEVGQLYHLCRLSPLNSHFNLPWSLSSKLTLCQAPPQHLENTEESSQIINLELQISCPLLHTDLLDLSMY